MSARLNKYHIWFTVDGRMKPGPKDGDELVPIVFRRVWLDINKEVIPAKAQRRYGPEFGGATLTITEIKCVANNR